MHAHVVQSTHAGMPNLGGSGGMPLFCTKSLFCTIVSLGVTYFSKAEGLMPPHCYAYAHIPIYCITYYTQRIVLGHKAHKMAGCATVHVLHYHPQQQLNIQVLYLLTYTIPSMI